MLKFEASHLIEPAIDGNRFEVFRVSRVAGYCRVSAEQSVGEARELCEAAIIDRIVTCN